MNISAQLCMFLGGLVGNIWLSLRLVKSWKQRKCIAHLYLLNMTYANIAFTFGIPLWWIEIILHDGISVE